MRIAAAVVALIACVHVGLWALSQDQLSAPNFDGPLTSVSYSPFGSSANPTAGDIANAAQIRSDLKLIAPHARAIRTYSSTRGIELVPPIANEVGLKVTVGAQIDDPTEGSEREMAETKARNERELKAAVELARKNRNVNGVIVGNETLYRGVFLSNEDIDAKIAKGGDEKKLNEKRIAELIRLLDRTRHELQGLRIPVSTGEIYSEWEKHPELASHVDFIAAHILPYWEGKSEHEAVAEAITIYDRLRQLFPGKRIVIAEFGWPSAGYNRQAANPSRDAQAVVVRGFLSRAEALGIDYNIIEAIDQPWKVFEGSVGPYWGMFDAARQPKFAWTGPVIDSDHWKIAAIAVLVGLLLSLPILTLAGATVGQSMLLAVAVNVVGAWCATVFAYWNGHYFVPGAFFALVLGLILLAPLVVIALSRIEEIAAIAFGRKPRRLLTAAPTDPATGYVPKVSIHIPAYREPPEMLKQTLDAVARLDYPNFECVLVINNTPDPALWRPVEEHCRTLGERFKFVNAEKLAGFKAGALRLALVHTAADADIIGVIDADYAVHTDWLKDLVPAFADAGVGLIQAPQDHRDGDRTIMHYAMNGEYAGFFDAGMVQRNENNAIIVHGTMCLIRRTALETAGSWSSDTICEDTDLGLAIIEHGFTALYTNRRYGWGLLPDTYEAFRKQRHRWAYGGMQIVKKHWRRFLPGASRLNGDQKRDFALGWITWLGAETVGVAVAILNLIWLPFIVWLGIAIPDRILTVPILASFALSLLHFLAVYRLRVSIRPGQMLGSMVAAMSVQWTVAKAVCDGLIKDHLPFVRTAKGGGGRRRGYEFQAFWEAVLGGLLIAGAILLIATNEQHVREIYIFAGVLMVQSLPFLSAVVIAVGESSRLNDFAFWRGLEGRLGELLPRRIVAKAPATADKRIETVQ
jgi:cellulose synthase/poly-beta-1,6-N-acetylglucosamine synthase-like glycosyltransferase/exo-beta-1,3-glucanase (GH17 family)